MENNDKIIRPWCTECPIYEVCKSGKLDCNLQTYRCRKWSFTHEEHELFELDGYAYFMDKEAWEKNPKNCIRHFPFLKTFYHHHRNLYDSVYDMFIDAMKKKRGYLCQLKIL
jgi:hypothetical protein